MAASYSVLTAAMVMLTLLLALLLYGKSAYTTSVQCTGYRYQLITDLAQIRILPVQDTDTN